LVFRFAQSDFVWKHLLARAQKTNHIAGLTPSGVDEIGSVVIGEIGEACAHELSPGESKIPRHGIYATRTNLKHWMIKVGCKRRP
jgi:hypothetical protein